MFTIAKKCFAVSYISETTGHTWIKLRITPPTVIKKFYIYYWNWNCSCPEYSWHTASWTLNNNQSIKPTVKYWDSISVQYTMYHIYWSLSHHSGYLYFSFNSIYIESIWNKLLTRWAITGCWETCLLMEMLKIFN